MLPLLTFTTMVQRFATSARASTSVALDFTVGSVFRALAEAQAAVGLWMQWLILLVLARTRLSTSTGPDADSFGADYGFTRLAAIAALGTVTMSRATSGVAAFIPVGATVRTTDGTQSFMVASDSSGTQGYTIAASASSLDVPVVAVVPGSAGNVQADTVTVLTTALPGVDTVANAAPFAFGLDAESDAAFRARFVQFVDTRSRGTVGAVEYAIASVQQGLTYTVQENIQADGSAREGFFLVTVDDGSGYPSAALLATIQAAIEAIRPIGTAFAVQGPVIVPATISVTFTVQPGFSKPALIGPVRAAILAYVQQQPVGYGLGYFHIAQTILNVPGVGNANNMLLNGGTADIGGGPTQRVIATSANVVVS